MIIRIKKSLLKESKEERQKLEKQYFGDDLRDIGESLKFLVDNNRDQYGEVDYYAISQILRDSGQTKIKYAGQGAFRITYSYGNDVVIKVAKTNTAKVMNEQDAELGRLPKYSLLFPKVYMAEYDFSWIAMEKCEEIDDAGVFISFFPNKVLDSYIKTSYAISPHFLTIIFHSLLEAQSDIIKGESISYGQINTIENYIGNNNLTEDDIKKMIRGYNTTFHLLAQMVAEFGINPLEIRPYNTGISPDGRFVVIDSSIASAIDVGIGSVP
jgi:hypothetical protein